MSLIVSFPSNCSLSTSKLGGKGFSLMQMSNEGFAVPKGIILTTEFFSPWFNKIKETKPWAHLSKHRPEDWRDCCQQLQALVQDFHFTQEQGAAVAEVKARLACHGDRFAVRSSSPDEDLLHCSFAGGYETFLGVTVEGLESAIIRCFASSLDHRVFIYKSQNGFDILRPSIAVIIQQQIDSDSAGVAFSLNPSTNDYDELVINANWGLGESVVSGQVTPDSFIIDKVSLNIIDRQIAKKAQAIKLASDCGSQAYTDTRSKEPSLSDSQLVELTKVVCQLEDFYQFPIDVEWAFHLGDLYILQARPITTYIPISEEMQTLPGKARRLYGDAALSKGMTTNSPMSTMELDWHERFVSSFFKQHFKLALTPEDGIIFFSGARMYLNYSNLIWLSSLKKMAKANAANDVLLGEILANIDETHYRPHSRPKWIKIGLVGSMFKIVWMSRHCIGSMLSGLFSPQKAHHKFLQSVETYQSLFARKLDYSLPFLEFQNTYAKPMWQQVFNRSLAALAAGLIAQKLIKFTVGKKNSKQIKLVEKMQIGYEGNVVVDMGIALHHLAKQIPSEEFENISALSHKIIERKMPDRFMQDWDSFMAIYGCRGPEEMDVASPRYADDPKLALTQMSFMTGEDYNPKQVHQQQIKQHKEAYTELIESLGWFKRKIVCHMETVSSLFVGARDTPKHQIVLYKNALRQHLLLQADRLVQQGRLQRPEHIFDLTPEDLKDNNLCLQERRQHHNEFSNKLKAQVRAFPQVIDSRGKIHRPAPSASNANELIGMPVSSGVVTGLIKVLNTPDEKPIKPGDILVAYSTDPGWTPLFVSAAAIILEVGGILQHGAVVAREYGKPCVAGIDQVTSTLKDGQRVEVNGDTGTVSILTK